MGHWRCRGEAANRNFLGQDHRSFDVRGYPNFGVWQAGKGGGEGGSCNRLSQAVPDLPDWMRLIGHLLQHGTWCWSSRIRTKPETGYRNVLASNIMLFLKLLTSYSWSRSKWLSYYLDSLIASPPPIPRSGIHMFKVHTSLKIISWRPFSQIRNAESLWRLLIRRASTEHKAPLCACIAHEHQGPFILVP